MADGHDLATGGVAGGVVAVLSAIVNAIGVRRRLRAVESKAKRTAAELAELRDQTDARVQDLEAEIEALRQARPMPADEVRALVGNELERLRVAIQTEMKKTMDDRFSALRDRLAELRRMVKRIAEASKKETER